MTVEEVIKKLAEFPPQTAVYVDGGLLDATEFEIDDDGDLHVGPIDTGDEEEDDDEEDEE